jgi:hypothetical protein
VRVFRGFLMGFRGFGGEKGGGIGGENSRLVGMSHWVAFGRIDGGVGLVATGVKAVAAARWWARTDIAGPPFLAAVADCGILTCS